MQEFNPKVSIVIPVYNGANFMREAIDSALSQTYQNIEVIVVNDGSVDDGKTDAIAKSYGDKIKYISKENGGVSSALNVGIKNMTGEYFSWLSHDDKYGPEKIKSAVELLSTYDNREKLVAYTRSELIDSNSNFIKFTKTNLEQGRIYKGREIVSHMMRVEMLGGCSLLLPKMVFDECGTFDEALRYNQDAVMWYKIFCSNYSLVSDNKVNVFYRIHANQVTTLRSDLLQKDSYTATFEVMPYLYNASEDKYNLVFEYALYNAKYNCKKAVDECVKYGMSHKCLSAFERMHISMYVKYGKMREFLKKVYYKYILHINKK